MRPEELGRQVARRRKEQRMRQEDLAKKADISRNYVSLIERGVARNVSTGVISRLAFALGTTTTQLMEGIGEDRSLIPPSLRQFGLQRDLSYEAVDRLSRISSRGQEPQTVEGWAKLYDAIKDFL